MEQQIIAGAGSCRQLRGYLRERGLQKLLLVCGGSYDRLRIREEIEASGAELVRFSGFAPNPRYEDVCEGTALFRRAGCDGILAVGGGSAIDVAKCVKLYSKMDPGRSYLEQELSDTGVPLIAVPTTAGTGSESTHFAVIYFQGVKQSVTHDSILPDLAVLDPEALLGLHLYQKKSTMLDALCQAIESWWSVNATAESIGYARRAAEAIRDVWAAYIDGAEPDAAERMMLAANDAGRAINITQTTAPHAMSYKLTSLYGLPHGNAVAVCLPEVWGYMLAHPEKCTDVRGAGYLQGVFRDIAGALGQDSPQAAVDWFRRLMQTLEMRYPVAGSWPGEWREMVQAVNPTRLKNNPVALDEGALQELYERIVRHEA